MISTKRYNPNQLQNVANRISGGIVMFVGLSTGQTLQGVSGTIGK